MSIVAFVVAVGAGVLAARSVRDVVLRRVPVFVPEALRAPAPALAGWRDPDNHGRDDWRRKPPDSSHRDPVDETPALPHLPPGLQGPPPSDGERCPIRSCRGPLVVRPRDGARWCLRCESLFYPDGRVA